jgi:hypothetical protein
MLGMSISPFPARPVTPGSERRQARLVALLVAAGIGFSLLAYAISPGVRHAVGHAAHSVKGAVGHVLDRDRAAKAPAAQGSSKSTTGRSSHRGHTTRTPVRH